MHSTSRRRRRNNPATPASHPGAVGPAAARDPASGLPQLPPPATFAIAREPDPAPRPAAPPNPTPLEPQARAPMPPPPSSSSSSSSRRGGRNRGGGRGKDEGAQETRDWAALPLDVISAILGKLDHIEILLGPGKVCRSWRRAARDEPALWRRIDMLGHPDLDRRVNLYGMAQAAIRRAKGQCESFWAECAADDNVLHLLGDQAPALKSLRLISCQDIVEFEEEIKKFPLLEELEISLTNIGGKHVFEEVGKACPELKHFRFNKYCFHNFGDIEYSEDDDDNVALGIATMHGLHSLQVFGNDFTNAGLTAILDNCTYLEFLDIRHCFNIEMDGALRAKCAAIKTLKLPCDSTDDYNLQFEGPISGLGSDFNIDSDDYILDSDEYGDYCDQMFLEGMRMLLRDDDNDDDDNDDDNDY